MLVVMCCTLGSFSHYCLSESSAPRSPTVVAILPWSKFLGHLVCRVSQYWLVNQSFFVKTQCTSTGGGEYSHYIKSKTLRATLTQTSQHLRLTAADGQFAHTFCDCVSWNNTPHQQVVVVRIQKRKLEDWGLWMYMKQSGICWSFSHHSLTHHVRFIPDVHENICVLE